MAKGRLTARQERILAFIREYLDEHSRPPTIREIQAAVEASSTSVVDYNLRKLEQLGYLRRDRELSRGIELSDEVERRRRARVHAVPIVGRIAAGQPIEAVAEPDREVLYLPSDLSSDGCYALRVKGTSMIEDCIDDGDLVVVRPQATAQDGDIVVALLADGPAGEPEATLKRLYREVGRLRLQPANSAMAPIYASPDHLHVQGRVVAVIRRM
ncbi:MAG: transcriptional repressor LexA [Chloroflexi bacterium]|nr:transcriptional repressor LexA [Chloroflexota bacterium]MBI4506817.1 transcriptional repressor LexA [Chloroflexota bacterium]